jgi:hypothetical protein
MDQLNPVQLQSVEGEQRFGPVAVHGCPSWGSKNQTELDLQTLSVIRNAAEIR